MKRIDEAAIPEDTSKPQRVSVVDEDRREPPVPSAIDQTIQSPVKEDPFDRSADVAAPSQFGAEPLGADRDMNSESFKSNAPLNNILKDVLVE